MNNFILCLDWISVSPLQYFLRQFSANWFLLLQSLLFSTHAWLFPFFVCLTTEITVYFALFTEFLFVTLFLHFIHYFCIVQFSDSFQLCSLIFNTMRSRKHSQKLQDFAKLRRVVTNQCSHLVSGLFYWRYIVHVFDKVLVKIGFGRVQVIVAFRWSELKAVVYRQRIWSGSVEK